MALPLVAAWVGHTDASREWAQDIASALAGCGLKHEAAAAVMEIHPADFSRQLSGRDPLNLWRLASLPAGFWLALFALRVGRIGGVVWTADQVALVRGAAEMGVRHMAKMLLPVHSERKAS